METQQGKSFAEKGANGRKLALGQDARKAGRLRLIFDNCIGKLLTVKELAAVFSVSERTVRHWILKDKIPVIRVNGCIRFEPLALSDWLAARSEDP